MSSSLFRNTFAPFLWLLLAGCAGPQDGTSSWSGGTRHEKLSDTSFLITSITNGGSGPARLRPLLIAKGQELAAASGYSGFVVRDPVLTFGSSGDGHVARAVVRLVNSEPIPLEGFEYFPATNKPDTGHEPVTKENSASVEGSKNDDGRTRLVLSPWYVQAVSSDGGFWGRRTLALRPTNQMIGVHIFHCKSGILLSDCGQNSVSIRATLESGNAYRVGGEVKGRNLSIWLENITTGKTIGNKTTTLSEA